jgi:hypothetical protein
MKSKLLIIFVLSIFLQENLFSQPVVWNMESLKNAKVEKPENVNYVIQEADKVLKKTISPIIEKTLIAPSGDKHDYISCGPYWWPDPANPNGPYIRKDGEKNLAVLTADKKNLGIMTKGIVYLTLAYYFTSDEKYAKKADENLRIWFLNPETRMNPNVNYGQTIYGHLGGKGRGAGMIETYTFVDMLDGIELLKKSQLFTKKDREGLNKWFNEYLNWMMTSQVGNQEFKAKNNHGTAFDVQATRVALFVGKNDIAKKYMKEFPERRLFTQIEPDGKQPAELARTKALHYSSFNIVHMLDMCFIAKTMKINLLNVKSDDGICISKALNFMVQFLDKPQSNFPYKQINEWNDDQELLRLQVYRCDKLTKKSVISFFEVL